MTVPEMLLPARLMTAKSLAVVRLRGQFGFSTATGAPDFL
jgi:hypothetical protein